MVRSGEVRAGEGAGRQSIPAQLIGNDQVMAVGVTDHPDDSLQRVVGILVGVERAG